MRYRYIDKSDYKYRVYENGDIEIMFGSDKRKTAYPRLVNQHKNKQGYTKVRIFVNGRYRNFFTHRLVAQAFISNPKNKKTVNHINGVKNDNRIENLEWATQQENNRHARRTGLSVNKLGEDNLLSKIILDTESGVFYSCAREVSDLYNIPYSTMRSKLNGRLKNNTKFIYA
jgi:hypothetical protein